MKITSSLIIAASVLSASLALAATPIQPITIPVQVKFATALPSSTVLNIVSSMTVKGKTVSGPAGTLALNAGATHLPSHQFSFPTSISTTTPGSALPSKLAYTFSISTGNQTCTKVVSAGYKAGALTQITNNNSTCPNI